MNPLRPYQHHAVEAVFREWEKVTATMVVIFTGGGKTRIFAEIIKRMQPKRSIVIAHRDELIQQAATHIRDCGLNVEIEKAELEASESMFSTSPVIVASVQTLVSGKLQKRMEKFRPNDFGLLVIDECFPEGTLVDGRPIESIRKGDIIRTHIGCGTVQRVFRKKCNKICQIKFSNGKSISSTVGHPFFTQRGWVPASLLTNEDMVASIINHDSHLFTMPNEFSCFFIESTTDVLQGLRTQMANQIENSSARNALRGMRSSVSTTEQQKGSWNGAHGDGLLFRQLQEVQTAKNFFRNHGFYESEICFRTNEEEESDVDSGVPSQSFGISSRKRLEASNSRRQRKASAYSSAGIGSGVGLAMRTCGADSNSERQWISNLLQDRYCESGFDDRDRSGRIVALWTEGSRRKEGFFFEFPRVESVEIYEQGSGGRFEQLCPQGEVFNLQVSNGNTYFANDILVHNCHHGIANSYKAIIDHFKKNPDLKIFGCTATPDRVDEMALGEFINSVAYEYGISEGIDDGWLVPIEQQMIRVGSLDFSHVRTTAGDLNGADLAAVMEDEKNLQGITGAAIEMIGQRKTIVFASSVRHAEMCAEIFNRHRSGMACSISGKTPDQDRRLILKDFKEGRTQVLVNVGIATEGFDCPDAEIVVMARPTKSRSLYTQIVGRVTRPLTGLLNNLNSAFERRQAIAESNKKTCTVLDFVGNSGRHKLITTADILGGKYSDEVKEHARKKASKSKAPVNMKTLLQESEEEIRKRMEQARKAEEARKSRLVAKVQYSKREVNPFDLFDRNDIHRSPWDKGRVLSEKQRQLLLKMQVNPDELSYSEGVRLIAQKMATWKGTAPASEKQEKVLRRAHWWEEGMSNGEASRRISELAKNNWERPHLQPA